MVFVDDVPLLQANFLRARASLRGDELLEVANGVVRLAFYAHATAYEDVYKGRGGKLSEVCCEKGLKGGFGGWNCLPSLSLTRTSIIVGFCRG